MNNTKPRIALVRGPNLNSWEMQNFVPLMDRYEFAGFTSYGHNFPITGIPFPVQKKFSIGQSLRARALRSIMSGAMGDYHDLQGLQSSLQGFDIVHTSECAYYCSYQAAVAKRSSRFKLVVTVWENIPFLNNYRRTERNKRVVFEEADLILAISQRARETLLLEGAPAGRIAVLMPGIDVRHFSPTPKDENLLRTFGFSRKDMIVLFVGNLYREKGIFDLLFAFRRLLDRAPSTRARLLLVGSGRDRDSAEGLIKKLLLAENVILAGSFSYSTMPKIHNLADVLVLPSIPIPSWQEQFGYVLAEGMACGKAVISTLSGSIPEVMGDAGLLVPPNDYVALADCLEDILLNPARRRKLGAAARKRAAAKFDATSVARRISKHYEDLLRSG